MDPGSTGPPAGLRLRVVEPLVDRDGTCPLVYDLERGQLLPVPAEVRPHLAHALEAGNLDDGLVGWLAEQDLLTYADPAAAPAVGAPAAPSPALDGGGSLGAVWFGEDEVHCHPAAGGELGALAALDALLASTESGCRVVLHLRSQGARRRPVGLRRLIAGARRLAGQRGRAVALEVITDGREITAAVARFLADHDLAVRLVGGSRGAIDLLLRHLPDRLTLCRVLDTGDRLADLWERAAGLGVRRLHAVKVNDRPGHGPLAVPAAEQRQFRRDLFAAADDLFAALAAGRSPVPLYEPLARVVCRHLSGRPAAVGHGGSGGYLGLVGRGGLFPLLGPLATALPAAGLDGCARCWARGLCSRRPWALAGPEDGLPAPRRDRCEFWRAEVEVGLLLYDRLEREDPATFLGLAEQGVDTAFFDPYGLAGAADPPAC